MSVPTTATSTRPFGNVAVNTIPSDTRSKASTEPKTKKAKTSKNDAPVKIYTFSFDSSPAYFQVLSTNTLYDLVDIAFQVCDPRDGDEVDDHLWNLVVGESIYESGDFPCQSELRAERTKLSKVANVLNENSKLKLEYDYGATSSHIFTVLSVQDAHDDFDTSRFPRRKPQAPPPTSNFVTCEVDLDIKYPTLKRWAGEAKELNFFQAGRRHVHGYFGRAMGETFEMIYLPDKVKSLDHYLSCLEKGAQIESDGGYTWHSIVILPEDSNKLKKYNADLEPGFCDCEVVSEPDSVALNKIFPKIAALAGFRKDKKIKKGWIRYMDDVLMVVVGSGSPKSCPQAPRGTAFEGQGCHVPSASEDVLFRVEKHVASIHELFCEVEGLLRTL